MHSFVEEFSLAWTKVCIKQSAPDEEFKGEKNPIKKLNIMSKTKLN